ncbi:signal transduction histidine kinase [Kineococcus xinjiangensis]|uniref:histidine kinase n=1 Tax=Kineococcus xinjiangensis TaxID=512762 RepID=A0A2S6IUX9_9ACTN|nr:ATP-binding protein [Kineococcus xinjiangensis]PPK98080.1 signal transduction histidine kinase [Kineococcus xinjiangensis]
MPTRAAGSPIVRRTALATLAGGILTVVVVAVPSLRLAYRSPAGHLVLETAVSLIGALLALLLYGRFRRSRALDELLLVRALVLLAVAALVFGAVPVVAGSGDQSALTTWAPLLVRLVGAVMLLVAALVPHHRVRVLVRPLREALVLGALLGVLAVAVQLAAAWLPVAVTALPQPEQSARPVIEGHPVVLAVQAVSFVCYAGAAVAFTVRAHRSGDDLLGWVGAACALGGWARVNYLLFPSIYSEWLYTGDLLRLGFYLLLLVGAVREVRDYWSAQAEAAASAERRRLARDLHDGAVQELGYIRMLARPEPLDRATAVQIRAAAERALDEARRAIAALAAPVDEPVAEAVGRAVREVADRYDVPLTFQARWEDGRLPAEQREALVRIAREAVSNAARHADPSGITVSLEAGQLIVADDGSGFEHGGRPGSGYGLTSMRDRAEAIAGRLSVDSQPGAGTRVTVVW